jgi:type IV secretory pathway VirB2 component (pilin)
MVRFQKGFMPFSLEHPNGVLNKIIIIIIIIIITMGAIFGEFSFHALG